MKRGSNAEGRICEICQRHLLAGETFRYLDDPARKRHRRPVCALCQRPALSKGWTPTVELPAPDAVILRRHGRDPDVEGEPVSTPDD